MPPFIMKYFIALDVKEYNLKSGITPVNLVWKHKTLKNWVKGLSFNTNDIIIGHSLGGAVAAIVASKTPPKELHLYSPSPFFTESKHLLDKSDLKYIGKRRMKDIKKIPNISCKTYIYYGSDEDKRMARNAHKIHCHITNSKLKEIKGTNHMTVVKNLLK